MAAAPCSSEQATNKEGIDSRSWWICGGELERWTYPDREVQRQRNAAEVGGCEGQTFLGDQMAHCCVRSAWCPHWERPL